MIEVALVFGHNHEILLWHDPEGRTAGSIPDSSNLWHFIWEHRHQVVGVAHSHPGCGLPSPSRIDVTTFAAIEAALGRRLRWPIVNEDGYVYVMWSSGRYDVWLPSDSSEPHWVEELRIRSGVKVSHASASRRS